MAYNPNKMLTVEIHLNDMANVSGYTIWHVVAGERKAAISRNADGKDFDWMTETETKQFEGGKCTFRISADNAMNFFNYIY